jgi:hypothetical protein
MNTGREADIGFNLGRFVRLRLGSLRKGDRALHGAKEIGRGEYDGLDARISVFLAGRRECGGQARL